MTCPACTAASTNPLTGRYTADCEECKARALANGAELFKSKRAGVKSPQYADALRKVFGEGNEEAGHERVRAWSKKINQHKKGQS
jgi:hypothetical protein